MLGSVGALTPSRCFTELHSDEIPDLTVRAVAHVAGKKLTCYFPGDLGPERQRLLQLETRACRGDVFQQSGHLTEFPGKIPPPDLHHVRTEYPCFRTPLSLHEPHIDASAVALHAAGRGIAPRTVAIRTEPARGIIGDK